MPIPYTPPGTILYGLMKNTNPAARMNEPIMIREYEINHFREKSRSL
jgi:hypothetical protein